MSNEESTAYTIAAVRDAALELGLHPLDDAIVARVVEYGVEALVECTLALDQPYVVDANVRGVIYARSIERIAQAIAAKYNERAIAA
jgi:predicted RNase H-like nuclease